MLVACTYINIIFSLFQVVALNSSLAAEGELYVDDGKSFEFMQGAYIHRRFIFSDGKLTSTNLGPKNADKNKFSSECVVERIILIGIPTGKKSALIEPSNDNVDIELGPIQLHTGKAPAVATIRRPNVRIADDWTIKIL